MSMKILLAAGFIVSISSGLAIAQTTTTPTARSPVSGDTVQRTVRKPTSSRAARARDIARSDKQPAGTENGNQPDRAAAGGGAR